MRDTVSMSPPLDRDRMADEFALIQAARTDPTAFSSLYECHRDRVYWPSWHGPRATRFPSSCTTARRASGQPSCAPSSRRRPSGLDRVGSTTKVDRTVRMIGAEENPP